MLAPDIILMFPPYSFVMSDEFSHKTFCVIWWNQSKNKNLRLHVKTMLYITWSTKVEGWIETPHTPQLPILTTVSPQEYQTFLHMKRIQVYMGKGIFIT